ncbi:MAG: 2-methylisocitrate lyase-like PEP mutase family enzyme [Flavobacterium sp.]|jgi:2-methylisocitrate lyase-like PEP mutase family enzyme
MLSKLINAGQQIIIPGVFDALSAKIAIDAGFESIYMSGFAVAATLLAKPDIGLVTASEMTQRAQQIVEAAKGIPVIADGDNGYGGEYNVARLVRAYERAGVACIQLEDQVSPKRCGHMENKQVVSIGEAARKIAMAVSSRENQDFLIMARTDARATHDLDEALRRGDAFLNAGADILFIEAPLSISEMEKIKNTFPNTPLVANMVEDGKTPELSSAELEALGYQFVLRPVSALLALTKNLQESYGSLYQTGKLKPSIERLKFANFNTLMGLDELLLDQKR